MKDLILLLFSLFLSFNALGQASLSGKITDAETGEPILFGDIVVYQDGKLITGEQTDFDGNYIISPIYTGVYEVVFKYIGYSDLKIENVIIEDDNETILNASIKAGVTFSCPLIMRNCGAPIIEQDNFDKGQIFTSKDIQRLPNKN